VAGALGLVEILVRQKRRKVEDQVVVVGFTRHPLALLELEHLGKVMPGALELLEILPFMAQAAAEELARLGKLALRRRAEMVV
jgi:hypothetical protein